MTAKPCHHTTTAPECWPCWLGEHDRRYQRLWGLPETAPPARPPLPAWVLRSDGTGDGTPAPGRFSLACVLRGDPTGETRPCKTCGGVRDVPLYSCPVHGVCSAEGPRVEGVPWCRTCPDKRPE